MNITIFNCLKDNRHHTFLQTARKAYQPTVLLRQTDKTPSLISDCMAKAFPLCKKAQTTAQNTFNKLPERPYFNILAIPFKKPLPLMTTHFRKLLHL